jgi:hypothetical protein
MKKLISKNIFIGNGVINIVEENISISLLKKEIEKRYRLRVIEESSTYLKCKILRVFTIWIFSAVGAGFPNPTLTIKLDKKLNKDLLIINFLWSDYFYIMLLALFLGIISMSFIPPIFILLFLGILAFVHSKYVSLKIWKVLLH